MKRIFILSLLLPLLFIGCGKKTNTETEMEVELQGISLNKKSVELEIGQTVNLIVVYNPEDAEKFAPEVTWESSSPSVAIVENGKVTAKQKGHATISAYCGKFYADCQVDVITGGENVIDWDAPYLMLSPNVINDNSYGGEYEVKVISNQSWSVTCGESWLSVSPSSGEGDGTVKITVAEKSTEAADEGVVTFTAGEIEKKITVKRAKRYVSAPYASPSQWSVPVGGTSFTVSVFHSSSEWEVSCSDESVSFSEKTNSSVKITVAANKSMLQDQPTDDRTMEVIFKNKEGLSTSMIITQPNPYASFQIKTEDCELANGTTRAGGETVSEINAKTGGVKYKLYIHTNIPWEIQMRYKINSQYDDDDYLSIAPTSGTGDNIVSIQYINQHSGSQGMNEGKMYFCGRGAWSPDNYMRKVICSTYYYQYLIDKYKNVPNYYDY